MQIRKPTKQAIAYRFFEHRKRPYLSLCSLFQFPFDRPRDIATEQEMWPFATARLSPFALEEGLPKGVAEVLMVGACHAPEGKAVRELEVGVRLGGIAKRLRVTGPRVWRQDWDNLYRASAPEAFASLPVTWQAAFGGTGFARNPEGRGFVAEGLSADRVALPLVEYADDPVADPDSRPRPASFAPIPQDWPQRMQYTGTYGEPYLRSGQFPGLAPDIDFRAFNRAPADQRQKAWFAGDETFEILHMHPGRPRIVSRLPEIRARCFLRDRVAGSGGRFREVPQHMDTVWLFPDALCGIVAFRGVAELASAFGDEVQHLLFAYERLGTAPRDAGHYRRELDLRVDPKASASLLSHDRGLKPEDEEEPLPDPRLVVRLKGRRAPLAPALAALLATQDALLERAAREVGSSLAALQADGPATVPPEVAALDELVLDFNNPASIDHDGLRARVEAAETAMRAQAEGMVAEQTQARDALVKGMRDRLTASGMDYDGFERKMAAKAQRPIAEIWKEGKQGYFAANAQFAAQGPEFGGFFAALRVEADKVDAQTAELDAIRRQGERALGHVLPLPAAPSPAQAAFARAALEEVLRDGEPVAGLAMAGIDLAGMEFSGRNLAEVDFRGANLRGAQFRGANLTAASLAQADIAGADFTGADLTEANLAGTAAAGAIFAKATLTDTNCAGMTAPKARFGGAALLRTGMAEAGLPGADFSGARLEDILMNDGDLTGAVFRDAVLGQVVFSGTPLAGADFSDAVLRVVLAQNASLDGALFERAQLEQFGVQGDGASLRKCRFAGVRIATCSMRGLDLSGADFTEALVDQVDFSEIRMEGGRFDRAVARGAIFTKARIARSSFVRGNFSHAVWVEAQAIQCDFTGSVLYGGNFLRAVLQDSRFAGANLARSSLEEA